MAAQKCETMTFYQRIDKYHGMLRRFHDQSISVSRLLTTFHPLDLISKFVVNLHFIAAEQLNWAVVR